MRRLLTLVLLSLATLAHADEQIRSTAPYQSINIKGPISLAVEAGKAHRLKILNFDGIGAVKAGD